MTGERGKRIWPKWHCCGCFGRKLCMSRRIGKNDRPDESNAGTCAIPYGHHRMRRVHKATTKTRGPHGHHPGLGVRMATVRTSSPPQDCEFYLSVPGTAWHRVRAVAIRTRLRTVTVRTWLSPRGGLADSTTCRHTTCPGYGCAAELPFLQYVARNAT